MSQWIIFMGHWPRISEIAVLRASIARIDRGD